MCSQALDTAISSSAGHAGVGGGKATDGTEMTLWELGWRCTGCQVVGSLGCTQVLLLKKCLKILPEPQLEMVASGFLLLFSCLRVVIKLGQALHLRQVCMGVILEVVFLQCLQLAVDAPLTSSRVKDPPLSWV